MGQETDRDIGADEDRRDEHGILAVPLAGQGDEIGETGLVGTDAFAGDMMPHQRAPAMADAEVAERLEGA